jgi:GNAT superfamily N-acetyltransferase
MSSDDIRKITHIVGDDSLYKHFVRRINKEFDIADEQRNAHVHVLYEEDKDKQIAFCVIGDSPSKMKVWEETFKEEGWVKKDFEMPSPVYELMYMYVKPEYRKKGIGSKLFQRAFDFSRNNGVNSIYAYVGDRDPSSLSFYKANGAKVVEDFSDPDISAAFLEWSLA